MKEYCNLPKINQEQALNIIKFFIQSNGNLFLFGQKGTGKTHIALKAIQDCGFKISYINLSVIERCDLGGFPDVNSVGDLIKFKSPHYLPKLVDKPDTVLLFDEVDKCPPEVTGPLLEILQFRKINGENLNIASCILTGNLFTDNSNSNFLSLALLDRGAKYVLDFDFNHWIDWAKVNNIHDLILGFLRSNPDFILAKSIDDSYASPSPRGWTLASDAITKAKELKIVDIETITNIISGFVGNEAGLRFKIWYEYYRKFELFIHSLIDTGIMNLDFNNLLPTEKVVFVISACFYAKQKTFSDKSKNKFIYLENLCNFFEQYNVDNEVKIMGLYNSFDFDLIVKNELYKCKPFFDMFSSINEALNSKIK